MTEVPDNETRTHMLDVAEDLFGKRGYNAVKLRDIAEAVGIHHASLYYYVPGGKKQLFVEVTERSFNRHRDGLTEAIASAGGDLRDQLYAVAIWLASHGPVDFSRMRQGDMPAITDDEAQALMMLGYDALRTPIVGVLEQAVRAGRIAEQDLDVAAMALVSLVQSVHSIPYASPLPWRQRICTHLVNMLLDGLLKR